MVVEKNYDDLYQNNELYEKECDEEMGEEKAIVKYVKKDIFS